MRPIKTNKQQKKRATIDLVLHQRNDIKLTDAKKILRNLDDSNGLSSYACLDAKDKDETIAIMAVLNHYEFVATGIREDAFDERVYKRMLYGILVKDWNNLEAFVVELRKTRFHNTLYQEYQWLAEKWKKNPLERS